MEKWLRKDLEESEKLYNELLALDKERPDIEVKQKSIDSEIKKAHREFVFEAVCCNTPEALTAKNKVLAGLDKKFSIGDAHYRKREAVAIPLREITQKYQISCISDLNKLVKQILLQRKFQIEERASDSFTARPLFFINHNWICVGDAVERLMETMDKIRNSDLLPLAEIRRTYEECIKGIPDDFPLTDKAKGGAGMLRRFQEGIGEASISIEKDTFMEMNIETSKTIGEVGRLKQVLQSLKSFFKNAEA